MRGLRWSILVATTVGLALLLVVPDRAVIAGRVPAPRPSIDTLEVFATSPVLVRAGERVEVPVDVVCATADGIGCPATAVLSVAAGSAGWRSVRTPARADLRFDVTAPVGRAIADAGTGSVAFRVQAVAGARAPISPTQGTGAAPTQRIYVTRDLPTVRLPVATEHSRAGRDVLFLPWGTGRLRAGLRPGNESPTLGPSSFDVGRRGAIVLVDAMQGRLARFVGGRLVRQVPLGSSVWADVAVVRGIAYLASRVPGSRWRGEVRVVNRRGAVRTVTAELPGMPSEITSSEGRPFVRVLPLDAWVAADGAGRSVATSSIGRPLQGPSELLVVGTDERLRVGIVRGGRVRRAVEVVPGGSRLRFGEVALAEPDPAGGFWVVVHERSLRRGPRDRFRRGPRDRFRVVHVDRDLKIRSFAAPAGGFAGSMVLSRFRIGPDGALYQMRSEPDGLHVARYRLSTWLRGDEG